MDSITIDGQHEDAFRQSIEDMLRRGLADDAALHLRTLLQPFTGEGAPFPVMGIDPGKNKKSDLLAKLMGDGTNVTE